MRYLVVRSFSKNAPMFAASSLVTIATLSVILSGCNSSYENTTTEAIVRPTASINVDLRVRQSAENFIKAVQKGNYSEAISLMSPDIQKQMSVADLEEKVKTGLLKPLATASQMTFEPALLNSKSNRATLRLAFDNAEQKGYRMNFVLKNTNGAWQILTIVPPTKHEPPVATIEGASTGQ